MKVIKLILFKVLKNNFCIILLEFILFLNSTELQGQKNNSIDYWEKNFLKVWNKEYIIAKKLSTSNDSWQFYNLAYYIDANVTMFKVTSNTKYIDRAIEYTLDMIDSSNGSNTFLTSQFKDNYEGWANYTAPSYKNDGKEYPLFESYAWRYVTDLLIELKRKELHTSKCYSDKYAKILDFTEINIYDKWSSRGRINLYRSNTHMMSHWVKISMNLYLLTNNEKYLPIITDFIEKFNCQKEFFYFNDKILYKWKADWNKEGNYQDVGHGNAVIDVLIAIYENNLGISYSEIEKLVDLFTNVIWIDRTTFANFLDGSGFGKGWFTDGFIKLGRYNKTLQSRIEKHKIGRTTQFFANGALNAKLLIE